MTIKLVVFDADKTLWSHHNVSSLSLPFRLVNCDTLADANGETFWLFQGIRELLEELRTKHIIMTIASWNKPEPVKEALRLFEINPFFMIVKAEFHPDKHHMIESTISELAEKGTKIRPNEILYIDDRTIHLENVRKMLGPIHFIQMWVDVKKPRDICEFLEKL
jgi:magnesium-dependent phosphatase-1